jgi:hypothetical protein
MYKKNAENKQEKIITDSICILSDFLSYGVYSSPPEFEEYFGTLTDILKKGKIKVKIVWYADGIQHKITQCGKPSDLRFKKDDEKDDEEIRKFETFINHPYGTELNDLNEIKKQLKGKEKTLTNAEFADAMTEIENCVQNLIKHYKSEQFEYKSINESRSFHYWIFNNYAIFSCNSYRNNNGKELAFRTIEPKLIEFFIQDTGVQTK